MLPGLWDVGEIRSVRGSGKKTRYEVKWEGYDSEVRFAFYTLTHMAPIVLTRSHVFRRIPGSR